jgi:hypothetical protein
MMLNFGLSGLKQFFSEKFCPHFMRIMLKGMAREKTLLPVGSFNRF